MNIDLAKEWASKSSETNGIVNEYEIDLASLDVLDLTDEKYSILNWLAILLQNRTFSLDNPLAAEARKYIIDNYYIDTSKYDFIIGYRADDSYFSYAQDFLNNTISLTHLSEAMKFGNLGIQHVLISKKAFEQLKFIKSIKTTSIDNQNFVTRDTKSIDDYRNFKINLKTIVDDIYVIDILKGGYKK